MYAQAFTPGRAAKMLLSLDKEENRLSHKYIRDIINMFFCIIIVS
jgi:hypothetical protein